MDRRICRQFLCGVLALLVSLGIAHAQSPADNLSQAASEKLRDGNTAAAITMYEEILTKYPTFEGIWGARYNLAFAYLGTQNYTKAIEKFKEVDSDKNKDVGLREQAAQIIGGVTAAMATAPANSANRATLLDDAVKLYDAFLRKYPSSKYKGEALYGKAAALMGSTKADEAEKSLNDFFKTNTPSLQGEAKYLMARVYAAQGRKMREDKKEVEAKKRVDEAKRVFNELSQDPQELVLANQALVAAGGIFQELGEYSDAIYYLRKVKPQLFLEEQQARRVEEIRRAKMDSIRTGDKGRQDDMSRLYDRENGRLREIKSGTPLYVSAQNLISVCLFTQKKYDEVIVLNRHIVPLITDVEFKKRGQYVIVKALLGKKDVTKAIEGQKEYDTLYPNDSIGEDLAISIADFYLRESKFLDAVKWVDEYIAKHPTGTLLEQAYFLRSTAYSSSGDVAKAEKANQEFQQKFPKSNLRGNVLLNEANTAYANKDWPKAIAKYQEYMVKFPESENAESASLLIGVSLFETKKFDDTIKALLEFEKKYPKSKQLPTALFQIGQAHESKRDIPNSVLTYKRIAKDFPDDKIGPQSLYHAGEVEASNGKLDDATKTFDQFIQQYPTHSLVPNCYLYKAGILQNQKKPDEAIAVYKQITEKFGDTAAAAEAYTNMGESAWGKASHMAAKPEKLAPEKQTEWKAAVAESQGYYETVIKKFPGDVAVDTALSQISALERAQLAAAFVTKDDVKAYFDKLSAAADPGLKIKIGFALGALFYQTGDKAEALKVMTEAYDKAGDVSLPNTGYEQYRKALFDGNQLDRVKTISEKQLTEKQTAGDDLGIAQASLGLGRVAFEKKDSATATTHFKVVLQKPWLLVPAFEAEYYLARIEEEDKKYDEAIKLYNVLFAKVKANHEMELQAKTVLRLGYCYLNKNNDTESLGYFLMMRNFSTYPELAAEGIYNSIQLMNKGNVNKPDGKTKFNKTDGDKFQKILLDNYGTSPWSKKP